jgi:microcin C transport system substrate-binding protein
VALLLGAAGVNAAPQHALTVYGEPAKYPAGFSHFAYTNPQAPKGGTMRRSAIEIGHFDHVLPYIDKGIGVSQIDGLIYSPLAQRSLDEPYTVYGLVARQMERSDDGLSCASTSTPRRVSPTASRSPPKTCATPSIYADDPGQPALSHSIRRRQRRRSRGAIDHSLRLQDQRKPHPAAGHRHPAGVSRTLVEDPRLRRWRRLRTATGQRPYKVSKVDSGRSITFERNPDWWGKDLPVSRGLYNFDHFSIEYFGDTDVARQVLRGGAYDYNREFSATGYSIGYDGPALSDGRLQKRTGHRGAATGQGFVFNLQNRCSRIAACVRHWPCSGISSGATGR